MRRRTGKRNLELRGEKAINCQIKWENLNVSSRFAPVIHSDGSDVDDRGGYKFKSPGLVRGELKALEYVHEDGNKCSESLHLSLFEK